MAKKIYPEILQENVYINPNFISKNLEIYSRNPDLSQLHIICIKCWIFVTCAI